MLKRRTFAVYLRLAEASRAEDYKVDEVAL